MGNPALLMHSLPVLLAAFLVIATSTGHSHQQLASSMAPPNPPQCPGQLHPNCGLTDKAGIYKTSPCSGYGACCGMCAEDPGNCTAWVFISDGPVYGKGPGKCKLRHTGATCRPNLQNHVSGDLSPPTPSPSPSPSPPPAPSPPKPPAAGRKPHIVLLIFLHSLLQVFEHT